MGGATAAQLRHRLLELDRRWEKLVERVALFPNPVSTRHLAALSAERNKLSDDLALLERAGG